MHGNNPQSHTLRLGFLLAQRHLQEDMKALCKLLRESIQDRAETKNNLYEKEFMLAYIFIAPSWRRSPPKHQEWPQEQETESTNLQMSQYCVSFNMAIPPKPPNTNQLESKYPDSQG